jgi:hypothetical protein
VKLVFPSLNPFPLLYTFVNFTAGAFNLSVFDVPSDCETMQPNRFKQLIEAEGGAVSNTRIISKPSVCMSN